MMHTGSRNLNEKERGIFDVLTAFLSGRLASVEVVNWALNLTPSESVKRAAILRLVNSPEGHSLTEPWQTAWRMIEEFWNVSSGGPQEDTKPYYISSRVKAGERSGSLIAAIVDCVAPRLRLSPIQKRGAKDSIKTKRPRTVAELLAAKLDSGKVVDPCTMALHEIEDDVFLTALADALDSALIQGLNIARRLGWDGERYFYRLGELHRAYFLPISERSADEHEPDEFHQGIAPTVKLLHFVVESLAKQRVLASREIFDRWKLTSSPFHARLWAAVARDQWVASATEVSTFLSDLDDNRFWNMQNFPEIAELRALRFQEFDLPAQQKLIIRFRKLPPQSHWPRGMDKMQLARARGYWCARELRRIEVAGGILDPKHSAWLASTTANFPELAQMTRLDEGFMGTPKATWVPPNPDARYSYLASQERLSALENALGSARVTWDDDPPERARDWVRQTGNAHILIADFEASPNCGAAFSKVWEQFGWTHSPAPEASEPDQAERLAQDARRVLVLLEHLPETTILLAIDGIAEWMSKWQQHAMKSRAGPLVWHRLWPIAIKVTDAAQQTDAALSLNLVARSSDDHAPMDLDTLNTPAGKFVGVFLDQCPKIDADENPFFDGSTVAAMRDAIISANGRSGLIARHRLIEHLPYFLRADSLWTMQYLVGALLDNGPNALSLWRALARRTQFDDVLRIIGDPMVDRALDFRLGRETRRSLAFSLIIECLHSLNEGRGPAVAYPRIQQMIRSLDDEVRSEAAGAVQRFVRDLSMPGTPLGHPNTPEDLFHRAAAPFLRDVWPQERSLSTPGVSKQLADLPATTGSAFALSVDVIQRFLIPFDTWSLADYGLFGDDDGVTKLSKIDDADKAQALLRLLDCTIGIGQTAVIPYGLDAALAQIGSIAPVLTTNPMFRRLAAAARR